jgi:deazaflavin-dependent oxidoreductase (nitroreductase family)
LRRTRQSSSSKASNIDRDQYLYLTTRGRKSGRPRAIEIWFTERQGRFYVIAEYDTSHWVQNLRSDPRVQVRIKDRQFPATARVLDAGDDSSSPDRELIREVQNLSRKKYGWGDGTVVELAPNE